MSYVILSAIFGTTLLLQTALHHRERRILYAMITGQESEEYQAITGSPRKPAIRRNYLKKSIGNAYRSMYGRDE